MDRAVTETAANSSDKMQRWYSMPVAEQLLNVGSEVHRAIRWKNREDYGKSANFCEKAIEFLRIMQTDPKNAGRVGEFEEGIFELQDYFLGDNIYNTTDETLIRYYDSFMAAYERTAG